MHWNERIKYASQLILSGQAGTLATLASRTLFPVGNPIFYGGHFVICRLKELHDLPLKLKFSGGVATTADIAELCRLYPEEAGFIRERLEAGQTSLIVRDGPNIAASVWCVRNLSDFVTNTSWAFIPDEGKGVWCHNARVEPAYRRAGAFLSLMRTIAAFARENDGFPLYGCIEVCNKPSIRAHLSSGWEFTHEVKHASLLGLKLFRVKKGDEGTKLEFRYALSLPDKHLH